jgi:hypothetical protein
MGFGPFERGLGAVSIGLQRVYLTVVPAEKVLTEMMVPRRLS